MAPYWSEYTYDALGNRTQLVEHTGTTSTTTSYQHAGTVSPHQLTAMTKTPATGSPVTTTFGWDKAGNQTTRTVGSTVQTQTWDAEGKLTGITGGGVTQTNVYDADGTRLIQKDAGGVTVHLPGGQEVRATSTATTATRWYAFAGQTVAVRTGKGLSGVSSIVTDGHGTPVASVKNTDWTAPVIRIRTDPFGSARNGQTGTVSGHGFLGAPADTTGLTLLGARFYDPGTGTFISPDPQLDPDNPAQLNAYVYSWNNPVTKSDPSGLDPANHSCDSAPNARDSRNASYGGSGGPSTQVKAQTQARAQAPESQIRLAGKKYSSKAYPDSLTGYYPTPWQQVLSFVFEDGPSDPYFFSGGYID